MRILKDFIIRGCKATLFDWNNRYLIKLEQGFLEQTYKISHHDVAGEDEVLKLLDDTFMDEVMARFSDMDRSLSETLQRV